MNNSINKKQIPLQYDIDTPHVTNVCHAENDTVYMLLIDKVTKFFSDNKKIFFDNNTNL
jgi:hypothetical protein